MSDKAGLELDGKIFYVVTNEGGEVVKEELDGDLCLRVLASVLDDAIQNPLLEEFLKDQEE